MEMFILALIFAIIVGIVANSRGRPGGLWFLGACLCWPIALVVLLCKPNLKKERLEQERNAAQQRRHDQLIAALALRSS